MKYYRVSVRESLYQNIINQVGYLAEHGSGQQLAAYMGRVYTTLSPHELRELWTLLQASNVVQKITIH